jgi:hypothetical protein
MFRSRPLSVPLAARPRLQSGAWRVASCIACLACLTWGELNVSKAADQSTEVPQKNELLYSPRVFFTAAGACLKPDWASQFLPPISAKLASRTHLALALGSILAEGYLAAQAEDPQHTRNLNKDLLNIAKPLGIHMELLERSKSLGESAEKRAWNLVSQELDGTHADLVRILHQNKDDELIHLVRIGTWVRATEAVSQLVGGHYSLDAADLLHQNEIAINYSKAVEALSDKTREDPVVAALYPRLLELGQLMRGPKQTPPTEQEIKTFAQTARSVLHDILSKP